jgi:hypothetical protein
MAIEVPGWTTFTGGDDGDACTLSTPSIGASGDMDCEGSMAVTLTVTGGIGPFSWGTTKGILTPTTGTTVVLTPPVNTYSGPIGTNAFSMGTKSKKTFCGCRSTVWDCYGTKWATCQSSHTCWNTGFACSCANCSQAADAVCVQPGHSGCGLPTCNDADGCPENNAHDFCINATGDCYPCAVSMNGGAVVTVTDSIGQTAFVTVLPLPRKTI